MKRDEAARCSELKRLMKKSSSSVKAQTKLSNLLKEGWGGPFVKFYFESPRKSNRKRVRSLASRAVVKLNKVHSQMTLAGFVPPS